MFCVQWQWHAYLIVLICLLLFIHSLCYSTWCDVFAGWCNTGVIDIYELKATYLLTYQVLMPDGGTEWRSPMWKPKTLTPLMKFDKYSPA